MSEKTSRKIVDIPTDDVEWFDEMYPQYGAWAWFVREAVKRFRAVRGEERPPGDVVEDAVSEIDMEDFT